MTLPPPTNVLVAYTMRGQLLFPPFEYVFWKVENTPDFLGTFSGYVGQLQNIIVASVQTITAPGSPAYNIPTGPAGGDLTAFYPNPLVVGINGTPINQTLVPTNNQVLTYNASDGYVEWHTPTVGFIAGGDLSGSSTDQTVIGLQTNPVEYQTLGAGQDGYVLTWEGTQWQAQSITSGSVTLAGDVTGAASSNTVRAIQGVVITGAASSGKVLEASSSIAASWQTPAPGFTAGGDLSGTSTDQTVIGLQTNPILAQMLGASQDGYALIWHNAGPYWEALPIPPGFSAGGDLSGTNTSQTVIGIDGVPLSITSLTTNQLLSYNGTNWINQLLVNANVSATAAIAGTKISPNFGSQNVLTTGTLGAGATTVTSLTDNTLGTGVVHSSSAGLFSSSLIVNADVSSSAAIAVTKLANGTDAQVLLTNGSNIPTWTSISGDLSLTDIGTTTVVALQNNSVKSGTLGAGQDQYVLTWNNGTNQWEALPASGGSAITSLTGDVTATGPGAAAATVAKVHGATVPAAGSLTTGNVLQVSGASALTYAAVNLAGGSNYVTGALPIANVAPGTSAQILMSNGTPATTWTTMGGDVTIGATGTTTVGQLQGSIVLSGTPSSGQVLTSTSSSAAHWATPAAAGITQLTSDVLAGPGSGSQAATVVAVSGDVAGTLNMGDATSTTTVNIGNGTFVSDIVMGTGGAGPTIQLGDGSSAVVVPNLSGYTNTFVLANSSGQLINTSSNMLYDSISAAVTAIQMNTSLNWINNPTGAPVITQLTPAATNTPAAGELFTFKAQDGTSAVSGNTNGGAGGGLYLEGGNGGVRQGSGNNGVGGNITLNSGSAGGVGANAGIITLQSGTSNVISFCQSGIELFPGAVSVAAGPSVTLSFVQYKYPYLEVSGSMTGNCTIIFPTNDGSLWYVDTNQVTFNGYTISFEANSNTSTVTGTVGDIYSVYYSGNAGKLYVVDLAATGGGSGITALTGDVTATGPGSSAAEVVGILNHALPALSTGFLEWNGSAWVFGSSGGGFSPGSDLSGNSTSTSTNQYVSSLSYSSAAAGGTITINGTSTAFQIASGNTGFTFNQASTSSGSGANMTIAAQGATGATNNGGNLVLEGGTSGSASAGYVKVASALVLPRTTQTGNYTIAYTDHTILANPSLGFNLTLPAPVDGIEFVIKDISGTAETNNVTIVRNGSEKIEGVAASYVLATNWGCLKLTTNGTDWFLVK